MAMSSFCGSQGGQSEQTPHLFGHSRTEHTKLRQAVHPPYEQLTGLGQRHARPTY